MSEMETLNAIVDEFNEKLSKWEDGSGCEAVFSWGFFGNPFGKKRLRIREVTKLVYRDEPSAESMRDILTKLKEEVVQAAVVSPK